ncbi:hypothetical protein GCM10028815_18860 [Mariniluteicoccus flavus]
MPSGLRIASQTIAATKTPASAAISARGLLALLGAGVLAEVLDAAGVLGVDGVSGVW